MIGLGARWKIEEHGISFSSSAAILLSHHEALSPFAHKKRLKQKAVTQILRIFSLKSRNEADERRLGSWWKCLMKVRGGRQNIDSDCFIIPQVYKINICSRFSQEWQQEARAEGEVYDSLKHCTWSHHKACKQRLHSRPPLASKPWHETFSDHSHNFTFSFLSPSWGSNILISSRVRR